MHGSNVWRRHSTHLSLKTAKKLANSIVMLFSTMALNHVFTCASPTDEGNKYFLVNEAFLQIYSGNIKSDRYMKREFFSKLPHGDIPGCVDSYIEHMRLGLCYLKILNLHNDIYVGNAKLLPPFRRRHSVPISLQNLCKFCTSGR